MRSLAAFASVLSGLAIAAPLEGSSYYAVKETHIVPPAFVRVGGAPEDHRIRLSVGLKQSQFEELERHLWEVSDPAHPRYGQHLSQDEINALIKPSEESIALVQEWLHQHIAPESIEYTPAKDFLSFTLSVAEVERLLDTEYSTYQHEDGTALVRTTQWSLPMNLHDHIDMIQPTTSFLRPLAQSKTFKVVPGTDGMHVEAENYSWPPPGVDQACNKSSITPTCLSTLYGTYGYNPQAGSKNQVALTDYLGEINNRSDAKLFLEKYRPSAIAGASEFKQVSIHGGTLQQTPETKKQLKGYIGVEGGLDIQTILGLTWPVPATAFSTGGKPPYNPDALSAADQNEPYLFFLQYILAQSSIPQVISNSYADDEQTVPISYAKRVCSMFAQLGARGTSVFFGSGDGGVTGAQSGPCKSNAGGNVNGKKEFIPIFPGSCPYVTTVGSTVDFSPEVVAYDPANGFVPGGGFSNYFAQPSWQSEAVSAYLKYFGNKYSQYYNKSGRAYPDVAAYGVNFTIAWDGQFFNVDGTSASTPTMASVIALLNDALISHGKPSMGFLNPWLYSKGYQAFTDVTSGNVNGCNTTGFSATTGWDPASGWGTPNFKQLLQLVGLPSGGNGWGPN